MTDELIELIRQSTVLYDTKSREYKNHLETSRWLKIPDVLSEKQVHHIVKQAIGVDGWSLKECDVRAATDGLAGFLAEHMRATLQVSVDGEVKSVHLFIKFIPWDNQPKAEFIANNKYFKRERYMFQVLDEIRDDIAPNPWCPKAYLYTDSIIVMPDLAVEGYASRHYLHTLDYEHVMFAVTTIARFHAAFANFETKKTIANNRPYNSNEECGSLLDDPTFCDSPFLKASAKLTANIIKAYSSKSYRNLPDLEQKLAKQYLVASDTVKEYKGTLNVLIHKDLWVNNLMFKYDNNVLTNAIIVDYQLIQYSPPAFDIMTFLYLTTSRSFREKHEKEIYDQYFDVFSANLSEDSKRRMAGLGYDKDSFLYWCEQGRMFGVLEPAANMPFMLMDPKVAQATFDDPETHDKYVKEDRTEPVLAYAQKCREYRERLLEISEEFVDRYVLNDL